MGFRVLLLSGVMALMSLSINGLVLPEFEEDVYSNISNFNNFGVEFTKTIAKERSGNYIISPISVNIALSMAAFGAEGKTKSELQQGLHLPKDDNVAKNRYQTLLENLKNIQDAELVVTSKIFTSNTFKVKDTFRETTKRYFRSESESMDFSKVDESVTAINNWALENTNNRIKDLVKPSDVQNALMILANAVYFQGNWAEQFPTYNTKPQPFYNDETTIKNVDMMSRRGEYNWGTIDQLNAKYIELPYESQNASMVIIVPNETNGLTNIEDNYDQIDFDELLNHQKSEVELSIPKFNIESELDLKSILQKMNIRDMFEPTANFRGINDDATLYANEVIQKTFVIVDEKGTEATAVTEIGMTGSSLDVTEAPKFTVDRPFISVIVAKYGKTIPLFNARVVDPVA